jgi:hypothetical protein
MSKMLFGLAAMALAAIAAVPLSARADEWPTRHYIHHPGRPPVCHYANGCCCLHVTYDYHRELKYTYGWHFDPRSFDETEPFYYYGAVKRYPHYWCTYTTAWR